MLKNSCKLLSLLSLLILASPILAQITTSEVKVEETNDITSIMGSLGVGTTNPADGKVQIHSESDEDTALRLQRGTFSMNGHGSFEIDAPGIFGGRFKVDKSGFVGIGDSAPFTNMTVNGNIGISNATIPMGLMTEVGGTTPILNMSVNFREPTKNTSYLGAAIRIDTRTASNYGLFQWLYRPENSTSDNKIMVLTKDGNLGIGVDEPTERLHINGKIRATGQVGWSDFVFEDSYNLPSLAQTEKFIQKNGHLKDIPSEKEVLDNGYDLGSMDAKLLQKIEELTLYLIEQNKLIEEQGKKIEALEKQVKKKN